MNNENNFLDKAHPIGYNDSNAKYEGIVDDYLLRPQIVKMDEQEAINDPSCRHEILVPDPDDTIGEAIYHGCNNRKCGQGFYIRPQ